MKYWRISIVYFIFFSVIGIFLPLWPLYLSMLSYSPIEIGQLMGLCMASKLIAPNIWSWLADRTQRPVSVIRLGAIAAWVSAATIFWADSYWTMAVAMFCYSFFWNAVLPQMEALLLLQLKDERHRYSVVRSWGSIGFTVAIILGGLIVDRWGIEQILIIMIGLLGGFYLSSLLCIREEAALLHSDCGLWRNMFLNCSNWFSRTQRKKIQENDQETLWVLLKRERREVTVLFTICMLMIMSHGPYYTFFTIFLESYHYSTSVIGWLVSIGVLAEIVLFFVIPRWVGRVTAFQLLYVGLLCAAIRWILMGFFPDNLPLLMMLQVLHAATYGAFHIGVILMVSALFGNVYRGTGQAFYSSIGFGVGGALGAYLSGVAWGTLEPSQTYGLATALALLGYLLAYRYLRGTHLSRLTL